MDRRQKLVAGLTVGAVVLIVAGLAAVAIGSGFYAGPPASGTQASGSPTASQTPAATASGASAQPGQTPVVPTASPSSTPSATPHPAGFTFRGSSLVYYASDGTVEPVPVPAGLRISVASDRAIYYAGSGNRYGLKAGSYAGEFKPDVTMQQADGSSAQTGGVLVVGAVASRLVADRLAAYESDSDRWIVALPVDIRTAGQHVDVSFDGFGLHGWSDTPRVVVRFVGALPVTNANPANTGYHVLVEDLGVTAWQVIDPLRLSLSTTKLDSAHLMNELLIYGSGSPSLKRDLLVDRHVAVGQQMLSAADEVSVSLVIQGSRADLGPDRVLQIGDVPVFVASS